MSYILITHKNYIIIEEWKSLQYKDHGIIKHFICYILGLICWHENCFPRIGTNLKQMFNKIPDLSSIKIGIIKI